MKVPLLDLTAQYQTLKEEVQAVMGEICESQYFILGPKVAEMEKRLAIYCNAAYAVGVSSGSDALLIALMSAGIRRGDLVLTTPYSFFATAGAVARLGAVPIFVDIESDTYNLDPLELARTLEAMSPADLERTKAVIPVHLFGQCADMDPILSLAKQYQLTVIEDAAQAIGSEYKGRRAGSMGDFGCFSFYPSKNLGAFGDGGLVTTQSDERDHMLRMLRNHGMEPKYYHAHIGGNFRLDALQAGVVTVKLKYLDDWTRQRQRNAARYRQLFEDAGLCNQIGLPAERQERHIYNQFVIDVGPRRDALRTFLEQKNVGTEIYYPVPLHQMTCFEYLGNKPGDHPVAERAAAQTIALPIYPELSEDQQAYVVACIESFLS